MHQENAILYNPQLDTFLLAAETGSFNKAAQILFISYSAVVKQINTLESFLGVTLFARTHHGVRLTDSGRILFDAAKHITAYSAETVRRMRDTDNVLPVIRVATSQITPPCFGDGFWKRLGEAMNGTEFQFVQYTNSAQNAREILKNLGQNYDVSPGFVNARMLALRECGGYALSREPVCISVPAGHRLAEREIIDVNDLHGCTLLMIKRGWNSTLDSLRDELERDHPPIRIEDFSLYTMDVFNRCQSSGCPLITVGMWSGVNPLLRTIAVNWTYSLPYGLLFSKAPSAKVAHLIQTLKRLSP